jgi:hypothetical protein
MLDALGVGRHSDGGGLYLFNQDGRSRWIYMYTLGGKRRVMGLGGYPSVSLKDARADPIYALARLDRDRPDLAMQVREGSMSANKVVRVACVSEIHTTLTTYATGKRLPTGAAP